MNFPRAFLRGSAITANSWALLTLAADPRIFDVKCEAFVLLRRIIVAESVYKIVELVGTSEESWEKAANAAVEKASQSIRGLRIAEVTEQDLVIEDGKVSAYRAKVKLSFKFE
jgi:flavin-binding protein dodecin